SSRRRHTRCYRDWSSDVCSSDLWTTWTPHVSQTCSLTQSGVRLVMIGRDASGRAPAGTVQVPGLSEDLLVRAIRDVAPGLPEDEIGRASCREGVERRGGGG